MRGDDERLRLLLEAWATLSKEIQQQIILLVSPDGLVFGSYRGLGIISADGELRGNIRSVEDCN